MGFPHNKTLARLTLKIFSIEFITVICNVLWYPVEKAVMRTHYAVVVF